MLHESRNLPTSSLLLVWISARTIFVSDASDRTARLYLSEDSACIMHRDAFDLSIRSSLTSTGDDCHVHTAAWSAVLAESKAWMISHNWIADGLLSGASGITVIVRNTFQQSASRLTQTKQNSHSSMLYFPLWLSTAAGECRTGPGTVTLFFS